MTEEEYAAADATALVALVNRGEAAPWIPTGHALARIAALDPTLGAVVALDGEGALAAARAVDRSLPLAGVPVLVKDTNVDVAGFATRHGSRFYADAPAATGDSELVRRLRAAGAVIVGRSKTPEFASDFVTEPVFGGPTRNPWNRDRAAGGSSGGSAAAVAARMVPAAHGTDCGGSIRVPAAACGLVGLKPTRGRIPQGPDVGERVSGMNVEGVLTRTVRDTALFLDMLAGPDPGAPYQAPHHAGSWRDALVAPSRRLTIGLTTTPPFGGAVAAPIAQATHRVAVALEAQGHAAVPWDWPDLTGFGEAAAVFWQGEIAELIEARIRALGREPGPDEIEPVCRRAWDETRSRSALDFLAAKSVQNRVSRAMSAAFAEIDVLLLPTTADFPPPIGAFVGLDYDAWCEAAYAYAPFTEIFNFTGQPAISLPVGLSEDGLPIGVQLAARFGEEALLLRLAPGFEEAKR
ncbi:MAG TPA: amidase [Stellaceae bacterium]|nr:amidase [Stellaceae bacterium]